MNVRSLQRCNDQGNHERVMMRPIPAFQITVYLLQGCLALGVNHSYVLLLSFKAMAYSAPTGATGIVWRRRRQRSEQYRTSSHTSFHFLRH